jgi:glycosyltransferase involved in cell wall biosynthesis
MKIALIHYRLVLKGGLETRLKNYIRYFTAKGNDVTVICTRVDPAIVLPEGMSILRVNLGIMPKLFRKWYFNYRLKTIMLKSRFDFSLSLGRTSHQDAVLAPANHLGYLIAMGSRCRSIGDILRIHLDRKAFHQTRLIFAASRMMKDEIIHFYDVDPLRIHVLYPPLNTEIFRRELKLRQYELKKKHGMDPEKITFLFVSVSHKRKGLDLLVRIFNSLDISRFELIIAGDRANLKLYPNIHELGYHRSMQELYSAADITIHPALFEPFGQIVSESLQCGTPVMVSSNTGAKEIITEATGWVIPDFEPETWIRVITALDLRKIRIPADFARSHHLTLEQHCDEMISVWNRTRQMG